MEDKEKRGGYPLGSTLLGVLLLVYFLFPPLLAWPIVAIYGASAYVPPAIRAFFWPISYLCNHVPLYDELIKMESEWIGLH